MEHYIEISHCPACAADSFKPFLSVKDFTVSGKTFNLKECSVCGMVITSPRPLSEDLGLYYKSSSYISHTDGNAGLFERVYQVVKRYALLKKLQIVFHYSGRKTGKLLDYGCGTGSFVEFANSNKWNAEGFEPDSDARVLAESKSPGKIFSRADEIKGSYDVISLWHVLEHVESVDEVIIFLMSRLNSNGCIIIAVPNRDSYDANHYREFWAAYDVPRHLYHFRPKDIEAIASRLGLRLVGTLPMVFDSFYVSILSERYKGASLGFIRGFMLGLYSNLVANKTGKKFSSQIYILKKAQ